MSGQHTPAPWLVGEDQSVDETWSIVTTSGGSIIANVNDRHDRLANARLIAAAPDLLEAAKEGRTDLMIAADNARDAAKTDSRWDGVADKLMERVRMMDAAIAKAEGRS